MFGGVRNPMIPTPHTVQHYTRTDGTADAHGNPVVQWSPPITGPGTTRAVVGWSGAGTSEPALAGHDRVVVDVQLLVPAGFPARALDRIRITGYPAGLYEIIGDPVDYTNGPFAGPLGHGFGYTLNLRRVDG
jgi:hypothetical protein